MSGYSRGVDAEDLFGSSFPFGTEQYGKKTTPSRTRQAAGGEEILDNRPAYYWLGMVLLLVIWYLITR